MRLTRTLDSGAGAQVAAMTTKSSSLHGYAALRHGGLDALLDDGVEVVLRQVVLPHGEHLVLGLLSHDLQVVLSCPVVHEDAGGLGDDGQGDRLLRLLRDAALLDGGRPVVLVGVLGVGAQGLSGEWGGGEGGMQQGLKYEGNNASRIPLGRGEM